MFLFILCCLLSFSGVVGVVLVMRISRDKIDKVFVFMVFMFCGGWFEGDIRRYK